jgi:nucleoside-diphosphate-sugar epimerase
MTSHRTTYLVTGGAGFIGSHLVATLVERGDAVRVVDNFITGTPENLAAVRDRVTVYSLDITKPDGLAEAMQGVDYVLHQAALPSVPRSVADPLSTHETCATGTLNILIAAKNAGVKRVVYAASSSAYGDIEGEFKREDMPTNPMSPYAAAKLAGENYCRAFAAVYGLETVCLRYFNVFGERQDPNSPYSAVIPLFIRAMLTGSRPVIYGDGTQSRDFTYVSNVVRGNLLACTAPNASGEVINVACGERISLLDLINTLNRLMGMDVQPEFATPRPGDVKHSRADISKAGELLGYEPLVSLQEGLSRTLAWMREAQHQG